MAISNHDRVGKAMDALKEGLGPFVEREYKNVYGKEWLTEAKAYIQDDNLQDGDSLAEWDTAALLRLMWETWNDVFRTTLGHGERSLVSELRTYRNNWAHQKRFSSDDTYRVLDSTVRLLMAVSAPQADEINRMKTELLRLQFDEQVRYERKRSAGTVVESQVTGVLKGWRDIVTPHKDVASGRYHQAEFAADLWQVHLGEGSDEYRDPTEFFRRTYLTDSLKQLLVGGVQRLTGGSGDPVVQLQTNFGGGKTHSMLALYHLFSGLDVTKLPGIESILQEAKVDSIPKARRVVLVGNKISPGSPSVKADGTVVRTLWGELAWQLGGKEAFDRIAQDDERATNPGDVLRDLFQEYGPCVILIDEWVAYARQLHDGSDLPAGSFETQFSFAQVLSESAKLAKHCLLVVSLPASDTGSSPMAQADNIEVGGQKGFEALERLRNVIGRLDASWRPASAEESFEIVRRRLFEPIVEPEQFKDRDVVSSAFADLYRSQHSEFPPECRDADYERRIKAAYPIHPEVFDRLYTDWSTLVKFQRTRGVLRLMAAVIHSLWEKGDKNPLIMPANIPIDDANVQSELTRYLSDNWVPVIEKDVDGPNALPLQIDSGVSNLGRNHATRRVARTIYMGSAPITAAARQGVEDRRIKLGCVMPGESPAIFGDALRRLAEAGTYLYRDGARYWYSTQPTVTKLAEDRAEQLRQDPDKVARQLEERLRADLRQMGDFNRVHPLPQSTQDVADDMDARLVVLGVEYAYGKEQGNPAETRAKEFLSSRGNAPRLYRNSLVFLAPDRARLPELDEALRRFLAWDSILEEQELLDLSPFQVKQAETQRASVDSAVAARIPETYQWLLVPVQDTPQAEVTWQALRLSGQQALAERASKKMLSDELLITGLGAIRLRMELDRVPLWRGTHVQVGQLVEDFARYLYLPRLKSTDILYKAIQDGITLMTWKDDTFAFAEGYDEGAERYRGLRAGELITLSDGSSSSMLVQALVARQQLDVETEAEKTDPVVVEGGDEKTGGDVGSGDPVEPPAREQMKRFYGAKDIDANRVGRDAGQIAEEVIAHLVGLVGADVKVTIEIEANVADGVPEDKVRTISENCRTLGFSSQGFEAE